MSSCRLAACKFFKTIFINRFNINLYNLVAGIGWVVPGLIAHWFGKQGVFKTISVLFITAVIVRLLVIIIFNGELIPVRFFIGEIA